MPTRTPAAPPAPCSLGHHSIGARVCWTHGLRLLTGVVLGHKAHQRWITVQLSDGTAKGMPCGGVAPDRRAVAR